MDMQDYCKLEWFKGVFMYMMMGLYIYLNSCVRISSSGNHARHGRHKLISGCHKLNYDEQCDNMSS